MKTLPSARENQIIKAAEQVVDMVNAGSSPDDALFKVAMSEELTPEYVKRLAEVFNVSRTLHHLKTAAAQNRGDSFPLADAGSVLKRMYPETSETGVKAAQKRCHSTWFGPPPNFLERTEKAAFNLAPPRPSYDRADLGLLLKRARNHVDSLTRSLDVAREDEHYAMEMLRDSVVKAASYFQSLSHVPFDAVESNVLTQCGSVAKPLMNAVFLACRGAQFGEKRGSACDTQRLFDDGLEPYKSIDNAVTWAKRAVAARAERQSIADEVNSFKTSLDTRMKKLAELGRKKIPFPFDDVKKSAGIVPLLASSTLIGSRLGDMFEDDGSGFESEVDKAIDPEHDTAMRAVQAQSLLNDLMTNDDVISGYPRDKVLAAFNEISRMTPRVADQPGLLRGMLARRLEMGRTEPFEATQAIDAETGLKNIEEGRRPFNR